jgi:hypothetical protein
VCVPAHGLLCLAVNRQRQLSAPCPPFRALRLIPLLPPSVRRCRLEYFSHSPFFDRQSTNQQLKMQTIHTGQPVLDEAEELRSVASARSTAIACAWRATRARALTGVLTILR